MAIISATSSIAGLVGVQPGLLFINTTDSLATVTTAGYLTKAVEEQLISIQVPTAKQPGGTIAFVTTTNGSAVLSVSVTGVAPNLVYSLVEPTFAGGAIFAGNVQAGLSGTAGKFISYPAGAGLGTLQFAAGNSAGNFNIIITNASQAGNRTYTIPDAGVTAAQFMMNAGVATMQAASRIVLDKATGTTVGFAVTINKMAGVITTEALTTAGGASQAIVLTNSAIATTSVLHVQVQGGSNTTQNISFVATPGAGTATINIFNNTDATALNGSIVFSFVVF